MIEKVMKPKATTTIVGGSIGGDNKSGNTNTGPNSK
jgi:hypothetical protein